MTIWMWIPSISSQKDLTSMPNPIKLLSELTLPTRFTSLGMSTKGYQPTFLFSQRIMNADSSSPRPTLRLTSLQSSPINLQTVLPRKTIIFIFWSHIDYKTRPPPPALLPELHAKGAKVIHMAKMQAGRQGARIPQFRSIIALATDLPKQLYTPVSYLYPDGRLRELYFIWWLFDSKGIWHSFKKALYSFAESIRTWLPYTVASYKHKGAS